MADFSIKQIKALLSGAGLPVEALENTAEEICSRHNTTLDAIKEERDELKKKADTLATVQQELNDLKAQKTDDGYKDKYEKEHDAFEKYKAEIAKEKVLEARKAAFVDVLKDAGITNEKSIAKILKYTNLDDDAYELDDKNKFKNAKEILKSVKEEWPEHITVDGKEGADTKHPPEHHDGTDFEKMSLVDKMTYANEHPNDEAVKAWLSK
jgi:hypothetical protein